MRAKEKRFLAEKALYFAIQGDYKSAAKIRQQAYALDPPGSIGVDWSDWFKIWETDFRYIRYMNTEDFSDVDNSQNKIQALKAGIFIDYLFGFRDCWGIKQQALLVTEMFKSKSVENFLVQNDWNFQCEDREIIYTNTKKANISARIYLDAVREKGLTDTIHPHIYKHGEYNLGFLPNTPKEIIDSRRNWLKIYDQYLNMCSVGIIGFPKTFETFEKHKKENSPKYQEWLRVFHEKRGE